MAGRKSAKKENTLSKNGKGKRKLDNKSEESPSKIVKLSQECKFKDEFGGVLQEKYGMALPDDFFLFFDFLVNNNLCLDCTGLKLTGPFDILSGNLSKDNTLEKVDYHLHGRCFYDVPEMMTVLYTNDNDGYHISYFRDFPDQMPQLLVSSKSDVNGELSTSGDNIFAAVFLYCKDLLRSANDKTKIKELNSLCKRIEDKATSYGYQLERTTSSHKARNKNVVTKSFHKAGLVVILDENDVGYRELPSSDRDLRKILQKIVDAKSDSERDSAFDELQEIITLIQFANDECDYGMGYELGIDLLIFGHEQFRRTILHLLPLAYQLLQRDIYGEILEKHLENRKKDGPISMLSL
ncbi:histone PARylation factor 1-like [Hydractinia symbiolongicarpus]|uniref:histone PARylation factor 1-like n=1 Tax=Hydractinia symbiolongicarpus TaxID=13093 RepID=UPI0025512A87|nr:histone PARylation factor 1-like [Hydractinia symbiolongicarpus]